MTIKITWLGHSAFQFHVAGKTILIDPFVSDSVAQSLAADFIVLTHGHADHLGETISIAQRTKATVIANYEITEWLKTKGVAGDCVHPMNTGGGYAFPFGRLKFTIAYHSSGLPDGSYGGNPSGLLFTLEGGKKIYHAGDTSLFLDMQLIGEEELDLAILPIGDNFTMGPDDALRAVKLLQPKQVIPAHFDTFPIIHQDARRWGERVEHDTGAKATILAPGESIEL